MLLRGGCDTPTAEQSLQRIYATAHHLHSLIGDVMDLASTQMGQMRLTWDTVELRQVLDAAARAGEQLTQDKGLAWQYDVLEVPPPVRGDATHLRQVALNLVANAVKFTEDGMVRLSASVEEGRIHVSVQDTGLGIPVAEQALIFDVTAAPLASSCVVIAVLMIPVPPIIRTCILPSGLVGILRKPLQDTAILLTILRSK